MAIDDLLDEHEQSERVLEWLRHNGAALVGGIVLGLAAIGGWKWWQQHEHQQGLSGADAYQAAVTAIESGDAQAAARVDALPDGILANLAGLELAASQATAGEIDPAIATLRAISPQSPAVTAIVERRLARLLIQADQAGAAIELVEGDTTPGALEVLGDARHALGETDAARDAYTRALTALDIASPQRRLLELKLTQVGGTPTGAGNDTEAQS